MACECGSQDIYMDGMCEDCFARTLRDGTRKVKSESEDGSTVTLRFRQSKGFKNYHEVRPSGKELYTWYGQT